MFHGNMGDVTSRSWHGFFTGNRDDRLGELEFSLYTRIPAAVRGDRRPQGIDIISRAGTISYESISDGVASR
jgi:hypothetical protein